MTSTGREVHRATIVIPIINCGTFNAFAITTAFWTKNSDPKYNPIAPNKNNNMVLKIPGYYVFSFSSEFKSSLTINLMERKIKTRSPKTKINPLKSQFYYPNKIAETKGMKQTLQPMK